ncbi:MAG: hypothetical protein JWM82_653, partial [Myxococcales bacterium]|nr:hypothetical protein [Myxococcales bacterium]
DPAAIKLGTVPSIPAGQTSTGPIVRQPDADATLASFASPLGRSFNILVGTTIVVPSGSPTPAGHLSLSVTGSVAATLAP